MKKGAGQRRGEKEKEGRGRGRDGEADWKVKIKGYEAAARPKSRSRKRLSAPFFERREKKERRIVHGKIKEKRGERRI